MITETYKYLSTSTKTQFIFQSEGIQGNTIKIVQFSLLSNGKWNLGFGDFKTGIIDDMVLSNNHDAIRVISTVAKITMEFFEQYPKSIVVIDPVDEKRKKLYNIVFKRHFKEIEANFQIIGYIEDKAEAYMPKFFYESFEISLKFEL